MTPGKEGQPMLSWECNLCERRVSSVRKMCPSLGCLGVRPEFRSKLPALREIRGFIRSEYNSYPCNCGSKDDLSHADDCDLKSYVDMLNRLTDEALERDEKRNRLIEDFLKRVRALRKGEGDAIQVMNAVDKIDRLDALTPAPKEEGKP